jgi:outer membrane protein assembly factor BamB
MQSTTRGLSQESTDNVSRVPGAWRWPLFLSFAVVALMAAGCVHAASPRGWAQPVQVGDVLLVSTHTGKLDGINPTTGDRLWRFPDDWNVAKNVPKTEGIYGKPLVIGDTVFVGDYNGYIYAFKPSEASSDKNNRREAASLNLNDPVIGGLGYDPATQTIYAGTTGNKLFARKAEGFASVFTFDAGDRIWSTPVVSGGNVYFGTTGGKLYALNAATGEKVWDFSAGAGLITTPVIENGTVLTGGFGRTLYALDAATGAKKWEFQAEDWIWGTPLVDGSRVFFGDLSGKVYALSMSDGKPQWDQPFDAGEAVRSGPALSSGTLIVGGDNGNIFGVDPATGAKAWGPVVVGTKLQADLLAASSGPTVYVAPTGCIGSDPDRGYYYKVNASTHERQSTSSVC